MYVGAVADEKLKGLALVLQEITVWQGKYDVQEYTMSTEQGKMQ